MNDASRPKVRVNYLSPGCAVFALGCTLNCYNSITDPLVEDPEIFRTISICNKGVGSRNIPGIISSRATYYNHTLSGYTH